VLGLFFNLFSFRRGQESITSFNRDQEGFSLQKLRKAKIHGIKILIIFLGYKRITIKYLGFSLLLSFSSSEPSFFLGGETQIHFLRLKGPYDLRRLSEETCAVS